jgi:integrase
MRPSRGTAGHVARWCYGRARRGRHPFGLWTPALFHLGGRQSSWRERVPSRWHHVAGQTSASTTWKVGGVLRAVLELAVRDRRIPSNPVVGVSLPRLPLTEQRFLRSDQLEILANGLPSDRDRVLTLLLGWTGLRFGEAAGLRSGAIDTLRRRLRITESVAEVRGRVIVGTPKSHAARTVALPGFLAPLLGEYLARVGRDGLAFPDRGGGPIRVTNWNRRTFVPAATHVGLVPPPLRVHDLRHTAASLTIASGAGVKVVQQQLGHASARLTFDRYAHLFPDELDALSSALDGLKARTPADSSRTVGGSTAVGDITTRRLTGGNGCGAGRT